MKQFVLALCPIEMNGAAWLEIPDNDPGGWPIRKGTFPIHCLPVWALSLLDQKS